jgi:hypothetical protein
MQGRAVIRSNKGAMQNKGRLSNRAREGEFAKRTSRETGRTERIINDVFADSEL